MLTMLGGRRRFCDGITRRESLQAGTLGMLGGLSLPSVLRAESASPQPPRIGKAKSVVVMYLHGGAPTQDMYDMKPQAPVEVRGEFNPIATSAPGIQICEHLPRSAKWMHKAAIVRSVVNRSNCHNTMPSFTGWDQFLEDLTILKDSYPPSMGSVIEYLNQHRALPSFAKRPAPPADLPAYAHLPAPLGWGGGPIKAGPYAGFLGKRYDPLEAMCTPTTDPGVPITVREDPALVKGVPRLPDNVLAQGVTIDRLSQRKGLLEQLDQQLRGPVLQTALSGFDRFQQKAFDVLTSNTLKAAFDPARIDATVRERYGDTLFGNSTFIAANLIESGVRFVTVLWDWYNGRLGGGTFQDFGWDTHMWNFQILKKYLPAVDLSFASLMEDLDRRGLLNETLVVVMSDFGRTPRVNKDAGRDHWIHCYSVLLAGAGIRGGTVYGASDDQAAWVKDRPVSHADIAATIYSAMGLDPHLLIQDKLGRPVPIGQYGQPIDDVLA